jgi:hypothetical protein
MYNLIEKDMVMMDELDKIDNKADYDYDRHVSALAHLSDETWHKVKHLPTNLALEQGEQGEQIDGIFEINNAMDRSGTNIMHKINKYKLTWEEIMSEQQILVPLDFIECVAKNATPNKCVNEANRILLSHVENKEANDFYRKWQGLEKLSEKNLKVVVAVIEALANKKEQ